MLNFLKVFLRGIICTILLPVILVVWILYGVYCLIVFIVMLIKSMVLFFMGDSAAGEMKEDIEAKRILLEQEQAQDQAQSMMNMMYQNAMSQIQAQQQIAAAPVMPQPEPQEMSPVEPLQTVENPVDETADLSEEGGNNEQSY